MPDLRPWEEYRKGMLNAEQKYVSALNGALSTARTVMVDRMLTMGIDHPALTMGLRADFQRLREVAQAIGEPMPAIVLRKAERFADRQLRFASKAPTLEEIRQTTGSQEARLAASAFDPAWVTIFEGRVASEVRRLRTAPTEDATREIFSTNLVLGRATAFRHATNTMQTDAGLATWGYGNQTVDTWYTAGAELVEEVWERQVVAAIDERTTSCCLLAHGQIRPLDEPFKLNGHPRFRDEMMAPPFHWNCRTGLALHLAEFEDMGITTAEMRQKALDEFKARMERKGRQEIHPAHATSGRS